MSESESDYERFRRALRQEAATPHPFAFYPKSDERGDACPECGCAMALDDNELAMIHAERRVGEARQLAEWVRDNPDQAPIVTFPWEVSETNDAAETFARRAAFGTSHLIVEPEPTHDHLALLKQMHGETTQLGRWTGVGRSAQVLALSCAIQEIEASRQRIADFEDNWGRARVAIAQRDQWLRETRQRIEDLARGIDDALRHQSFVKLYDLASEGVEPSGCESIQLTGERPGGCVLASGHDGDHEYVPLFGVGMCRSCKGRKTLWVVVDINGAGHLLEQNTGIPCPSCQPQDFDSHRSEAERVTTDG